MHVGIDFGTSNTAVAKLDEDGQLELLDYSLLGERTQSYRSLLFFDPEEQEVAQSIDYHAGCQAIEAYLDALGEGRLIQSFKTHLTTTSMGRTQIGPHSISLDDMLKLFFARLREEIHQRWGESPTALTLGRPVNFAGAKTPDASQAAQERLEKAARASGFSSLCFQLEPIAAALHYESQLDGPELVLVADFGGGTTDFCIMQLGHQRSNADRTQDIVATGGVGVAGDDLDAAIIQAVVAPQLGKGGRYREMGREAEIPASYYNKLSHWHQLSFLRGQRTRDELARLKRAALDPAPIAALMHLIEHNQGFHLHKSVERLKIALSTQEQADFLFEDESIKIEAKVDRSDFEDWIAVKVDAITQALDQTLAQAGVGAKDLGRVFMTGGTAFVPCVRRAFASRFGEHKLSGGNELLSIASGLALQAPA